MSSKVAQKAVFTQNKPNLDSYPVDRDTWYRGVRVTPIRATVIEYFEFRIRRQIQSNPLISLLGCREPRTAVLELAHASYVQPRELRLRLVPDAEPAAGTAFT